MNKLKFLLLTTAICIAVTGCKSGKEDTIEVTEELLEPEILKEYVIEEDSVVSIESVLGEQRTLTYDKYLNVKLPEIETTEAVIEETSPTEPETLADGSKRKKTKEEKKQEREAKKKAKELEKEAAKKEKERQKAEEESSKAAEKEAEERAKAESEAEAAGETIPEPLPDPDDDGNKKVVYVYQYLENGTTDAHTYIKYLVEQESFVPQWEYSEESPAGYVSLLKDSVVDKWNFQVDVDYTPREVRVILTRWKKAEEAKSEKAPLPEAISFSGAIDMLMRYLPEELGLPSDKPLEEYSFMANPGRVVKDSKEYYVVNIYNNHEDMSKTIVGSYYVAVDAAKILKYDIESDQYTDIALKDFKAVPEKTPETVSEMEVETDLIESSAAEQN